MTNPRISSNLISYAMIRRGNWVMKISVYKNLSVLLIGNHCFDGTFIIRQFLDKGLAADFIDNLAKED